MATKLNLTKSDVLFNQEEHTYMLGDKQLQGITSTLMKIAFPDTYKGISEARLKKAAEHGSLVHEQIEIFETLFDGNSLYCVNMGCTHEFDNYMLLKEKYNLTHQAQEYLVSDNEHFASAIDIIFTNDKDEIVLCDIKTTSKLMYEHVSLQLSIYAMLFEKMNPSMKVSHLSCMWLHGDDCKYVEVPRVSDETINELIAAYLNHNEEYHYKVEIPADFLTLEEKYIELTKLVNLYTDQQNEVKSKLMEIMGEKKMKNVSTAFGSYCYVPATTKKTFDSKRFKDENPDVYDTYLKESMTKPSMRIKLNN